MIFEQDNITSKYKKFVEIIRNNPDAQYFTYTSKTDGKKKKIILFVSNNNIVIKYPKHRFNKVTYFLHISTELFNDMGDDLQPSKTKKRIGLGQDKVYPGFESLEQRKTKTHEWDKKYNDLKDMVKEYGSGYYTYLNTKDNRKYKINLFVTSFCIYLKNSNRTNQPFSSNSELIVFGKDFQPVKEKLLSKTEKLYNNINKLKDLWISNKVHPNVWRKEVAKWKNLNMNEVRMKCVEFQDYHYPAYNLWCWIGSKYHISTVHYKTTTIDSWKPKIGDNSQYELYKQNIKKHLNGKEEFEYHWRTNYDIDVYSKVVDGEYRTFLTVKKNAGRRRSYFLLNENLLLFIDNRW